METTQLYSFVPINEAKDQIKETGRYSCLKDNSIWIEPGHSLLEQYDLGFRENVEILLPFSPEGKTAEEIEMDAFLEWTHNNRWAFTGKLWKRDMVTMTTYLLYGIFQRQPNNTEALSSSLPQEQPDTVRGVKYTKCVDCGKENETVTYRGPFNGFQCLECKKEQDITDEECR